MENIAESEEEFFSAEEFSNQELTDDVMGPEQPPSPFWFLEDVLFHIMKICLSLCITWILTEFILQTWFQDLDDVPQQHRDENGNGDCQDQPELSDLQDPGQDEQSEFQRVKTNVIPNSNLQRSEISSQRLKKLVKLFPQIDPGFLDFKVNEFEDEKQMNEWIAWAKKFFAGGGQCQNYQNDESQNNNTKEEAIIGTNHCPDPPSTELVDLNLIDFENPVNENCDYAEEAICLNYDFEEINNSEKIHNSARNIMDLPIPELVPDDLSNSGENTAKAARKILLAEGPAAKAIEAKNPIEYWDYVYR